MKKSFSTFMCLVMVSMLVFSLSGCDKGTKIKITPATAIKTMETIALIHSYAMPIIVAIPSSDTSTSICEINEQVRLYWNLVVTGFQVYLENKDAAQLDKVKVNLASFSTALDKILKVTKLDDKTKLLINTGVASCQTLLTTILPKIEFVNGEKYDLSRCELTFTCSVEPREINRDVVASQIVSHINEIPSELRSPEMDQLVKVLSAK